MQGWLCSCLCVHLEGPEQKYRYVGVAVPCASARGGDVVGREPLVHPACAEAAQACLAHFVSTWGLSRAKMCTKGIPFPSLPGLHSAPMPTWSHHPNFWLLHGPLVCDTEAPADPLTPHFPAIPIPLSQLVLLETTRRVTPRRG